jgi:cyclophilin family peptidyl-prolyl cis-trans isomerase
MSRRQRAQVVTAFVMACCLAGPILAQPVSTARLALLLAEDRRAPTAADLQTLRTGARSSDAQTARMAIRALGRLERPALIPDILPGLRHALPEVRSESANAAAQAARGWAKDETAKIPAGVPTLASVLSSLSARLDVEDEPSVRAAICESIGRLPYRSAEQAALAEAALVEQARRFDGITDRLGVAKGFEAFVRLTRTFRPASRAAIATIRKLFGMADAPVSADGASSGGSAARRPREPDPLRDARVRRLALESLIAADAVDDQVVVQGVADADSQVRRLSMLAVSVTGRGGATLSKGLDDMAAMVRFEALRAVRERAADQVCAAAMTLQNDSDAHVSLLAIDLLAQCGSSGEAVTSLENTVNDLSQAGSPRGWHRAAHAIVALASASPARAAAALGQFVNSTNRQLRTYAARAATVLNERDRLEKLAHDEDANVVEAAVDGMVKVAGHAGDAVYLAALSRTEYQAIRAAARALDGSPETDVAVSALNAALERLVTENHQNSLDVRAAIVSTLTALGSPPPPPKPQKAVSVPTPLNAEDLRRLAAPRARFTIAEVGTFDVALFTAEAPATVLEFAELAESGYYSGLTFHRVVPNFVIQGGSPGANEFVGHQNQMRDELGLWPHVRGAVGISTRGRDTGDAQIFIDLVDSPRLDHEYTVFAQVLNGIDIVDRILEGDVIEKIEILP